MKEEYLSGQNDDLADRGFVDSDTEIDFTIKKKKNEKIEEEVQSIFSRLTGAFQNYTGNKTMSKQDLEPVLKEFVDQLTDKNVSVEIAMEVCKQVEEQLLN